MLTTDFTSTMAIPVEEDECSHCDKITQWRGETCTTCGRIWGFDHPGDDISYLYATTVENLHGTIDDGKFLLTTFARTTGGSILRADVTVNTYVARSTATVQQLNRTAGRWTEITSIPAVTWANNVRFPEAPTDLALLELRADLRLVAKDMLITAAKALG